jgi:DNA-binding transcriptional MerR regulator
MDMLSIGQVARRAGVGVETIRFYEREGLLEEPPRRASGYRQYSEQVVKRIHFIKRAQKLGFPLKEITELLMLRVDGQTRLVKRSSRRRPRKLLRWSTN